MGIFTSKKEAFTFGWGKNAERVVIHSIRRGISHRRRDFFIGKSIFVVLPYIIKG